MIRRVFVVWLALLLLLLPACSKPSPVSDAPADGANSKLSKELNLFNWSEYLPQTILDKFEKEFGVKVNYDTYSSNEEMFAKLQAGASGYDLVVPTGYMVETLAGLGLLESMDHANLPNLKNIGKEFRGLWFDPENRYSVPYLWGTTGLVYNSKYVKEPVTSYRILWNPAYKGKVVLPDDAREVLGIGLRQLGHSINSRQSGELRSASDKLRTLMPSVKAFDSDNPKGLLITGEAWLAVTWSGEAALAIKENPDLRYTLPQDGGSRWMDNLVIPKGAPNKYTAEVFLNFLMRPEIAAELATEFPYGTPNIAAKKLLSQEVLKNPASYPAEEELQKIEWMKQIGETAKDYDKLYTALKAGS